MSHLSTFDPIASDAPMPGEVAARDLPARGRRGRRLSTSKTTTSQAESAEARSGTDADLSEEVQGNGSPTRPTGSRRTGPSKARAAKAVKAAPAQAAQVALAQADAGQAQAAQGRATAAADGKDGKVRGERAGAANFETEPAERVHPALVSLPSLFRSASAQSEMAGSHVSTIRSGRARSKMKASGDDPSDKKLKAANLENRSVARKLNQRQQELEKLAKQALGRKATVPRKQDTDTEAGWEKKIHGMQVSIRNGAKMADFWEERLGVWHEEVEARCGEEVLLELQRLSELKPPERDLMPLQMALLRRARTDMQNVDRVQQAGTDLKQRFAAAVEHGDVNLKDLQQEVSNMMKRLSADLSLGPPGLALTATAVSAGTAGATRSPAGRVGEGAADATTARRSVHKSMKSRKTAVEAAREALRQRMAGAHVLT
ncbi:URC1 [Symbiodinium sp. CCMP2456]|nr:URC1 [Symbiodinium sp. CCMP2456]